MDRPGLSLGRPAQVFLNRDWILVPTHGWGSFRNFMNLLFNQYVVVCDQTDTIVPKNVHHYNNVDY